MISMQIAKKCVGKAVLKIIYVLALAGSAGMAQAHKGSDAYLDVQEIADPAIEKTNLNTLATAAASTPAHRSFRFTYSVAIKDLDLLLPLDANADGKVTWGEVKAVTPLVLALLNETVNLDREQGQAINATACLLDWQSDGVERRSDGAYLRFAANPRCPATQAIALRYSLLKDQDATHRLLVAGRIAGQDLLTTTSPLQTSALPLGLAGAVSPALAAGNSGSNVLAAPIQALPTGRLQALRAYFLLGLHHLLEGLDHLAFLLALVLPLRLKLHFDSRRHVQPDQPPRLQTASRRQSLQPHMDGALSTSTTSTPTANSGKTSSKAWWALLRTITAFTVGHSITLMLATFGVTQASPVWVEPVIALSIAVTALLNLRPITWIRVDVLALLFGMVHGFGFAGLLQEAAAPAGLLPWALAGFNLGVEAGQLVAVSAWLLVSQLVVDKHWYPNVVVRGGSALLIAVATFWFWQRVV